MRSWDAISLQLRVRGPARAQPQSMDMKEELDTAADPGGSDPRKGFPMGKRNRTDGAGAAAAGQDYPLRAHLLTTSAAGRDGAVRSEKCTYKTGGEKHC